MDAVSERLGVLEQIVRKLSKDVSDLRAEKRRADNTSLQGFVQYQSVETYHPCFVQHKLSGDVDVAHSPNNVMCFTPTTLAMFTGSCSTPPLLAIKVLKTRDDAEVVEILGNFERRHRVDLLVEFHSAEIENFFTGVFKDGSKPAGSMRYETFVHVDNPTEFVRLLTERYKKTMSIWDSLEY